MTRSALQLLTPRGRRVGVALGVALLVAACGSGGSRTSGTKPSAITSNGVVSKSPAQIVAAAQAALRSANGFVLSGSLHQGREAAHLQIVDGGGSKFQTRISEGGQTAEIIVLRDAGYVRANQEFWTAHGVAALAGLANRWIEAPASDTQQIASAFGLLAPDTLARCLGEDLGTLSRDGSTTVDGSHAVVIRQAGNVPGGNPGTLAVAASGPAYPLRITSTGPTRPGGKIDVCNNGKGDDTEGSLTLSHFGHAPAITAPPNPVKAGSTASSPV